MTRRSFWKFTGGVLVAAAFLLNNTLAAPAKEDVVARVTDVQGKKLEVQRQGGAGWEKSKKDTAGFIKDHFRTGKDTTAVLELLVGARVGIKKGSEIVLLSEDAAGHVDGKNVRRIQLNQGGVYAKFNKQEKPVTIQTRGGVMGIKGTEFSVETEDDGETTVTLLEGSVDYTDEKGQTSEMVPGQKLRQFKKDDELYVVKGEPSEVDKTVADFLSGAIPITNIHSVQDALNTNWANLGPDTVNNIINSGRNSILQELPGPIGSLVNGFIPGSVIDWSGANFNYPGISIPTVPSIPSIPFP
jgi:hypothetical protein